MDKHWHLALTPMGNKTISGIMANLKRWVSRRLSELASAAGKDTEGASSRRAKSKGHSCRAKSKTFARSDFYPVGTFPTAMTSATAAKISGSRVFERRFDDNVILSKREMRQVVNYLHNNPVRAQLANTPADYFWSSARNYLGLSATAIDVDKDW